MPAPASSLKIGIASCCRNHGLRVVVLGLFLMVCEAVRAESAPSFRNEVMAVLSKAGCNQGACHGNARGKGGFQLSLRGQEPQADYQAIVHEWQGRRIDTFEAAKSLLLEKPLMLVPHEGGRRLTAGTIEHEILSRWIAAGAPEDPPSTPQLVSIEVSPRQRDLIVPSAAEATFRLEVLARFSDGTTKNVTRLTVFEPSQPVVEIDPEGMVRVQEFGAYAIVARYLDQQVTVRLAVFPPHAHAAAVERQPLSPIDEIVFRRLRELQIEPSTLCDDQTFIRRTTLDIIGLLPSAQEARDFVNNGDPQKRQKWIESLLARGEFADWWALKWCDLLRVEEKTLDAKGVAAFHGWIRDAIAKNQPVDEFVQELISARGSSYNVPATNYYRALRDPATRAEATAQIFLGARLQCAKCHNHPFDQWSQNDYYAWSNVFSQIDYQIVENQRGDTNDTHEFKGEQIILLKMKEQFPDPRTGQPRQPSLLDHKLPPLNAEDDRLLPMAQWLASRNNRRFVEVFVNRVWQQMLGRGIVEPVDDFRATNPATHPELLTWLSDEFVHHNCDLKWLVNTIANSAVYQSSSTTNPSNSRDEVFFSHSYVKRLSAEQLLDAISQATDVKPNFADHPQIQRAQALPGVQAMAFRRGKTTLADRFLREFGRPQRLQSCDCERTTETTLTQTFQLIGGKLIQEWVTHPDNILKTLATNHREADPSAIEELYWRIISRAPTSLEAETHRKYIEKSPTPREGFEDILWALLNSDEFLLRH
ncbi:hypothetical protein Spb1_05360 [Planctopirus ephydatiae]|uniref:Bacterial Ig-like domain (Group 2) n=1 Tax=Planctopirus ephydatiae TaxID=2528019 RepID=A0A518GJA5_9PLAN|nr:DUF1549 and DUF1553 domain-containing protein [Planctopirus ephydatiae]QDV28671.1 hypothetical protein Spb1_05360 [Planctopirus ephydatiae]